MERYLKRLFFLCFLFLFFQSSYATLETPTCIDTHGKPLLGAFYFGGGSLIMPKSLNAYTAAAKKLDVLYYSTGHLGILYNHGDFKLADITTQNLITLHQWIRKNNIKAKFILSLGRWNPKILTNKKTQNDFLKVFIDVMKDKDYGFSGMDVDWENYFSASPHEEANLPALLKRLRETLDQNGLQNACLSLDVPSITQFAKNYPDPKSWLSSVDWVNLMGYEFYIGDPPYTELDSSLGFVTVNYAGPPPNLTPNSIATALNFYHERGIPKQKLALIVPFFGNYFYVHQADGSDHYGLRQRIIDNRGSYENSYSDIYYKYGVYGHAKNGARVHQYTFDNPLAVKGAHAYWVTQLLIESPQVGKSYAFISYPDPIAMKEIADYVIHQGYLGLIGWQLAFDLPFAQRDSLLRILYGKTKK